MTTTRYILVSWTCPRCRCEVYEDECDCGQTYEPPRNGYTMNGSHPGTTERKAR